MSEEESIIGAIFVTVAGLFLLALVSTLAGAFTGWVVSLTPLGGAVIKIWIGLTKVECELWELGSFLGFISGFLEGIFSCK